MGGTVINCKKCNKIFQKKLHPICSACIQEEEEQFTRLYRLLQESATRGGVAIKDLSNAVGLSVDAIEKMYMEGRLSTAGLYLKMPCQGCSTLCGERDRKGRYCHKCSETTANKAGVEVKSVQELKKAEENEERRQQQDALLKKSQQYQARNGKQDQSRFGFSIRR